MVQCYARDPVDERRVRPWQRLVGFARVDVRAGESAAVRVPLDADALAVRSDGAWRVRPGEYAVACGASSADARALTGTLVLPASR